MNNSKKSPFPPGSLICAYLRDSGGEDQDLSVPQQEAAIRAWCEEHGLALGQIFADVAAPGSSVVSRTQFLRMIYRFRSPGCLEVGLVIWKFSRFARDIDDAQFYKADLRRMGYVIHSLTDNIPEGVDGRFFEAARDWMNEKFLQDLSEDVKRGLLHLVQTYGAMPGTPPRGFIRQPVNIGKRRDGSDHIVHRWAPDSDLWESCRLAWRMRSRQASYAQIHQATHLYKTIGCYNTFFANPLYKGELHFAGVVIKDYCEPLVDAATWEKLQPKGKTGATRSPGVKNPRRMASRFLLSGLAHCARCGSPLNGHVIQYKGKPSYDYYRCSRAVNRRDCDAQQVERLWLEDEILASVPGEILNPEKIREHQAAIDRRADGEAALVAAQRVELSKRITHVNRRIANATETLAELGSSPAMLSKLKTLEGEKADLQTQLERVAHPAMTRQVSDEEVHAKAARFRELEAGRPETTEELQRMLRGLIARVAVEREGRALRGLITYYHPPETDIFMPTGECPHGEAFHRHKYMFSFLNNHPSCHT